jgi:PAS domain-containing protein
LYEIAAAHEWVALFVNTMSAEIRRTGRHFFLAFIVVVFALGATEVLYRIDGRLAQHGVMAFFLAAVIVAAWRGGVVAAIFATLLSVLVGAWIMPPSNSFRISDTDDVIRLSLFVFLAALISYMHFARQRAERSLKESEGRLHFSLDSSGVACWDANVKGGTFWKSHNLPVIFGRTEADFATTYEGFFAYIYPEDREFFHLASVGSGANHRDYEISHRVVCGDGTIKRVSTRGRMYIDDEGRVERMVGAVFAVDNKLIGPSAGSQRGKLGDIAAYLI